MAVEFAHSVTEKRSPSSPPPYGHKKRKQQQRRSVTTAATTIMKSPIITRTLLVGMTLVLSMRFASGATKFGDRKLASEGGSEYLLRANGRGGVSPEDIMAPSATPTRVGSPTSGTVSNIWAQPTRGSGGLGGPNPTDVSPVTGPAPSDVSTPLSSEPSSTVPSSIPTETQMPSHRPPQSPTESPTSLPSGAPTRIEVPSTNPSIKPSVEPNLTESPSKGPSTSPTMAPTAKPSVTLSSLPSRQPSSSPSVGPSGAPTGKPSRTPSSSPFTGSPLVSPSSWPSVFPSSLASSGAPTTRESPSPTVRPSLTPSSSPSTGSPTRHPSGSPSVVTSGAATTPKSQSPTVKPSGTPSSSPSLLSITPTTIPSLSPTGVPSVEPSIPLPSASPSTTPTNTFQPSDAPSFSPTNSPTTAAPVICPDGLYGPQCVAPPRITSIFPENAFEAGGTVIRVKGVHFQHALTQSSYSCKFENAGIIRGTLVEEGVVECISPSLPFFMTDLSTTLTLFVDGIGSNEIPFTFFETCPPGYCDNGYCSFGVCVCLNGFRGEKCEEALVAPLIVDPEVILRPTENKRFRYQMRLQEGSFPIEWSIVGSRPPEGLSITENSGLLTWENPTANSMPTDIRIQARNGFSSHTVELSFIVLPSYIVKVSTETSAIARPEPTISFRVETRGVDSLQLVGGKLAQVWVRSGQFDHPRKIDVTTGSDGIAFVPYQPYEGDRGRFNYGGTHPTFESLNAQGQFTIRSIDVSPSNHHVTGNTYENIVLNDLFFFKFSGGIFSGLTVDYAVGNDALKVKTSLDANIGDQLHPVLLSITVGSAVAVSELIQMTLTSDEGDQINFQLFVDIRERAPKFRVSPGTLDVSIPQGGSLVQKDIIIENIGSRPSGEIEIDFSDSTIAHSICGHSMPGLAVGESRMVSIGFNAKEVDVSFYGSIIFRSDVAAEILHYRATVVPTEGGRTLTVVAQNEASFFADSHPNLAHATVHIRNVKDGSSRTATTEDDGTVLFDDLSEGIYEIRAHKEKHQDYRSSVFLQESAQTVFAFLQAEVTSYAFSVIHTDVGDRYIHQIESSYETFIPRPVVVWNPVRPDWEGIRDGRVKEIQLTATNYGAIKAQNVTLSWPRYWENVEFIFPGVERNVEDGTFHLGELHTNASFTFTIGIRPLIPFEVPSDRILRSASNGVFLEPRHYDQVEGFVVVFVPFRDPEDGRSYIQYDEDFLVKNIFDNSTATLYTFVYEGIEIIDVIVSESASWQEMSRRASSGSVEPSLSRSSSSFECAKQYVQQVLCGLDSLAFDFCEGSAAGKYMGF
eukprot:scaffold1352_cov180-Amphora_coffeaeformis.AAC.7